ncbi:MAG TPA: hypothetical protein ENI20_00415 [Bacteroides sp.]|nr:hypothetical protein [Bacteroides sp.]
MPNNYLTTEILPVDIVLAPEWWHKHTGICFDRDFFFHPSRRLEAEQKMEKILYEKWGKYGLGGENEFEKPEVGAVHLASGYLISEMLGCTVEYRENHPPLVLPAFQDDMDIDIEKAFKSEAFSQFLNLMDTLKKRQGYLTGDVNWSGILNIALDLRGENVLLDMSLNEKRTKDYFSQISKVIDKFVSGIKKETGTSSISVNRNVRNLKKPVFLHSECSHTMISSEDYEKLLLPFDVGWSHKYRPFGIHYCGDDPHRHARSFAKIPYLDFLDVGWGGDIKTLRKYLPDTFFNIRLSPVEIKKQPNEELRMMITRLVRESENPYLTGVCCINMDDEVEDKKIDTIFETVNDLRTNYLEDMSR